MSFTDHVSDRIRHDWTFRKYVPDTVPEYYVYFLDSHVYNLDREKLYSIKQITNNQCIILVAYFLLPENKTIPAPTSIKIIFIRHSKVSIRKLFSGAAPIERKQIRESENLVYKFII